MARKVAIPFHQQSVLICDEARDLLKDAGFELALNDLGRDLSKDELKQLVSDAYAVIAGVEVYDKEVLDAAQSLTVMMRFGVGTDNFDLGEMKVRGLSIGVISNRDAVAEFALTMMLALLKQLTRYDACARAGRWDRYPMYELRGRTVGLLGFGRIGQRLAQLLSGFGCRIIAYDPFMDERAAREAGVETAGFDDVLRKADIVSLHLPHNQQTFHAIDADALAKMKPGAYLINTARGPIVDEAALVAALRSGQLAGAALDVFEREPIAGDNPLCRLDNVLLAPHVSALSHETNYNGSLICAKSIIAVSQGGSPLFPLF